MDETTKYLLIKEAKIDQLTNSMKLILLNIRDSLIKLNKNRIKMIVKRLPSKDIRNIEKEAISQIPGFKEDYMEAKIKVAKLKLHPYVTKPAAAATALVSSTTKYSVDEIVKTGDMSLRNSKISSLVPGSSLLPLIQFGLFATFVGALFLTDGAIVIPTMKLVIKASVLLLSMLKGVLNALLVLLGEGIHEVSPEVLPGVEDIPTLKDMPLHQLFRTIDPNTFTSGS